MVTPPPPPVVRREAPPSKPATAVEMRRVATLVVEDGKLHWELLSEGRRSLEHAVETLGFLSQGMPGPLAGDAGFLRSELLLLLKKFASPAAVVPPSAKSDAPKTGGADRALPVGDR